MVNFTIYLWILMAKLETIQYFDFASADSIKSMLRRTRALSSHSAVIELANFHLQDEEINNLIDKYFIEYHEEARKGNIILGYFGWNIKSETGLIACELGCCKISISGITNMDPLKEHRWWCPLALGFEYHNVGQPYTSHSLSNVLSPSAIKRLKM